MSNTETNNIPLTTLYGYISTIESLFQGSHLTYKKIQDELEYLYGVIVERDTIARYYDEDGECKDCDEYVHYKNLGFV